MGITMLGFVGSYVKMPFLTYPFVFLFVGLLPGLAALGWSRDMAILFFHSHRFQHLFLPNLWRQRKKENYQYLISSRHAESKPSIRKPVFLTLVNVFGMIYLTLSLTHEILPNNSITNSSFLSIFLLSFISLIVASGLNVAAWLLKMNGYMFQNNAEGERVNLGNVFLERLAGFFGISVVVNFAYDIYKNSDFDALAAAIFVIILYTPSLIISYKILEKKHLQRLRKELDKKLEKYVEP